MKPEAGSRKPEAGSRKKPEEAGRPEDQQQTTHQQTTMAAGGELSRLTGSHSPSLPPSLPFPQINRVDSPASNHFTVCVEREGGVDLFRPSPVVVFGLRLRHVLVLYTMNVQFTKCIAQRLSSHCTVSRMNLRNSTVQYVGYLADDLCTLKTSCPFVRSFVAPRIPTSESRRKSCRLLKEIISTVYQLLSKY